MKNTSNSWTGTRACLEEAEFVRRKLNVLRREES